MVSLNPSTLLSGSGIDVASLVQQVLSSKSGQLQVLQQQQSDLQTQNQLLNGLSSDVASLLSAVNGLSDIFGPLSALSAQSSQSTILTASAQPSAAPGSHTIIVSTLAAQSTLYTDAVAANASLLPSGATSADIQIQVGGPGGTHDIAITPGSNDTLSSVVSYVNNQNWGVTASILSDASGSRLALVSNNPGSTSALSVTNNTSSLSFNPPVGGTDATFTVDGVPFSSDTNTVTGAIPGVTLNLLGAYPGVQVQVSVAPDTARITQAITGFVSAYNTVINDINQQFKVDPGTHSEGPLGSDSALRLLQSNLLNDSSYSPSSGAISSLNSLGISTNDDGTLSINSSQLGNAISSDPSSVLNFFQNSSLTGYANNFAKDLRSLNAPTTGILGLDLNENRIKQQNLANSLSDLQDRLSTEQRQLQTQFSQVNALLELFPSQLQAIRLELGLSTARNNSNSSGS